jgi:hypothetical protein
MSQFSRWTAVKGALVSVFLGIVSNILYALIQYVLGRPTFQFQEWIMVFIIALIASFSTYVIFNKKEKPVFMLSAEFKTQIEHFEKYFHHPHYAIIPNPFDKKPEFWDSFFDLSSAFLRESYLRLGKNFEKSKKDLTLEELKDISIDFCRIIENYLRFTRTLRSMASKYPLSEGIREQYNENFVTEFNTVFRPDLIKYLEKLERILGKENGLTAKIELASFIEK